jgi:glycosyltransferase involved in cell wall biosynthesis
VIAPDVGGLKDVLIHGENGYLYPADRQDLLCDAIMKVVENGRLAGFLGSKGRTSINGKFELDAVTENYCQVYHSMNSRARSTCA